MVAPGCRSWIAMSLEASVIAGLRPSERALRSSNGVAPYRQIPRRTMSACDFGCAKIAAELASVFGSAIPSVALSKRAIASSTPRSQSEVAKCVISAIDFTAPLFCNRSSAGLAASLVKPRRYMVIPDAAIAAAVRDPILISRCARIVLEPRVLAQEGELHRPDRAVPLLADDDLRDPFVGRVLVVDLVAVDEEDHVAVLLEGS